MEEKKLEKLTLQQKIVKISNEIRLKKDGKNDFNKYNYFTPDNIMMALNPLLDKYSVFTHFNLKWNLDIEMYTATLTITDGDKSETYVLDLEPSVISKVSGPQNAGSTMTYAKRYCLMNAFNIADDNADPDSNEMTKKTEEKKVETKENIKAKLNDLPNIQGSL